MVATKPDVFNHNLETVPSKYLTVRPGARYFHSLRLLQRAEEFDPTIFTRSGVMVGLGEESPEVVQMMDDLRSAGVDFLTIVQYLQPTPKHHPVMRFITPDEFVDYATIGAVMGFLLISCSPLTRSSDHAGDDFARPRRTLTGMLAQLAFIAPDYDADEVLEFGTGEMGTSEQILVSVAVDCKLGAMGLQQAV